MTLQFQEMGSGSCFTVFVVEVYACQESIVYMFVCICVYLLPKYLAMLQYHRRQRQYCTLPSPCFTSCPVLFTVLASGEGLGQAVDQTDTFFSEEPPQHKHIGKITLPASYHCQSTANQDHVPKREKTGLAQHRKCMQLKNRR